MTLTRRRRSGFTLVELLVAVSLMLLLMFLIDRLFFDTTRAVSAGVATGATIEGSRAVSDQIKQDATAMVDPVGGGFLVILNKKVNVQFKRPNGAMVGDTLRVDQLVFIRTGGGLRGLTPQAPTTYENYQSAGYAKVWYGHPRRTNADGSPGPDLNVGTNTNPLLWALGRQALLLGTNAPAPSVYASDATFDSAVVGYTSGTHVAASVPLQLSSGLTDVTDDILTDLHAYLIAPGNQDDYADRAYEYTYASARISANPNPIGTVALSSQVAQMHPYLTGNVSEFEVSFAGDYEATPNGDDPPDGKLDVDAAGNIRWYDIDNMPNVTGDPNGFNEVANAESPLANAGATIGSIGHDAFVFQHDRDAIPDNNNWPQLLRIRYRLHDPRGDYMTTVTGRAANGIDDDLDTTVDNIEEQQIQGRWFEQIVRVKRAP